MAKLTIRLCLAAALPAALAAAGACGSSEPFVYSDRVPYEWELWEQQQDAGADAADGDAGDAGAGDAAAPPSATSPAAATAKAERTVFPPDSFWNKDISSEPVDPKGYKFIESIGLDASLHADFSASDPDKNRPGTGIPYQYVGAEQKKAAVEFKWAAESDAGPYPIPDRPLIEAGKDRRLIVVDKDNWVLYELLNARRDGDKWKADSGAVFDLKSNKARPAGWTSADAAGLAIFPGLVKADEVFDRKAINHALRFTVKATQKAYVYPASHFSSDRWSNTLPPMGMWCRLKSTYKIDTFPKSVQVILRALQKHGMILADNGGSFHLSGAPDPRWDDSELAELKKIKGKDFEVIKMGDLKIN